MHPGRALGGGWLLALALACARTPVAAPAPADEAAPARAGPGARVPPAPASRLPDVPLVTGPLDLRVVYPPAGALVSARDSSFLLGSTGAGDAELTVNGAPVKVWPNGGWIAWLGLPADTALRFELRARTPRDSAVIVHELRAPPRFAAPATGLWIDTLSMTPQGRLWLPSGERVAVAVRAAPGAVLRLAFAGQTVPLVAAPRAPEPGEGVRAFDWDFAKHQRPVDSARYEGVVRSPAGTGGVLEALIGGDSLRVHWPLLVFAADSTPTVVELSDDPRGAGSTDRLVPGRAIPGGSYHWLFPNGTRALVSGRMNDELRLHLAEGLDAWVPYAEALPLPAGLPPPRGRVGSLTISEAPTMAAVRIPVGERLPFLVSESDRRLTLTVYGAGGDVNWIRYGAADSLVRRVGWRQEASDCLRLEFELTRPLWGYRARWLGTDLLIEIRRPPPIDGSAPFRGRLIVVDPGHPPLGATGPTGLREADANLAVARELARLLEEGGARVLLTRTADVPVDLAQRVRLADSVNADLLVSVHQNALPDGLNPFTNTGASVFYNHPRSLPLARAIQDRLVERLGVRDLGVGRGDLALARATWMPAVLTEGLHIIMPDQEAALRSERGRGLYARAVFEGVKDFLKAVSSEQ